MPFFEGGQVVQKDIKIPLNRRIRNLQYWIKNFTTFIHYYLLQQTKTALDALPHDKDIQESFRIYISEIIKSILYRIVTEKSETPSARPKWIIEAEVDILEVNVGNTFQEVTIVKRVPEGLPEVGEVNGFYYALKGTPQKKSKPLF